MGINNGVDAIKGYEMGVLTEGPKKKQKPELAVVIVDMQQKLLEKIALEKRDRIIQHQIRVIQYCSANGIPVAVLEAFGYFSTIAELHDCLFPLKVRGFRKSDNNGFTNSEFAEYLKEIGIKSLFFMGVYAGACVVDTARGGLDSGFNVATSEEVIAQPEHWRPDYYRKVFSEEGRLYLDGKSYLEKGKRVFIGDNGDLIDRLVGATHHY